MDVKSKKAEQSEVTRAKLIAAARELFTTQGYADTPTEEIVRRAGVTRGALYHQFEDKAELFHAVLEEMYEEMGTRVKRAAMAAGKRGTLEHLVEGCGAFLDECLDPSFQRIALLDAPAVLGWVKWRQCDEEHGFGMIKMALEVAMESGLIVEQPIDPLAHMFLGALNEGALAMVGAPDKIKARDDTKAVIERMIRGMAPATTTA